MNKCDVEKTTHSTDKYVETIEDHSMTISQLFAERHIFQGRSR